MKEFSHQVIIILIFAFLVICNARGQQYKINDTVQLKEVIIPSSFPIDTTTQKILFVLEQQPIREKPCEYLDFIVLYDDFSGIRFEMGNVRSVYTIYWVHDQDSIIFFSSSIYNKIKHIKNPDQIEKYLLNHRGRENDYLIQDIPGYYWTYRKNSPGVSYLFKKEEKLRNCHLEYYYHLIRQK